ncbi:MULTISPECIES: DUF5132 domain-containing protein [Streptomycetaceae]|uniref:DUF5132 domain-containing protein n=1 Tax=Streptomycetaceae TaxID=2062 RepID=UPI0030092A8D
MPPVVPPFLVGLIVAPLAKRLLRPVVSGVVRTSVGIAMEVKKAAYEVGENLNDLAAEVTADVVAAQITGADAGARSGDARTVAARAPMDEAVGHAESAAKTPKPRATAGKAH